jgi:hypothetical protein
LDWKKYGYDTRTTIPTNLVWKRPTEMSTNPNVMGSVGKPVPNGVRQMSLGDCWFLAASSSLSEVPERILRVMAVKKGYSKNGIFRFRFYVKNRWYGINIDDRLPSKSWGRSFTPWATQPSKNGAWWMPLLEKAYA